MGTGMGLENYSAAVTAVIPLKVVFFHVFTKKGSFFVKSCRRGQRPEKVQEPRKTAKVEEPHASLRPAPARVRFKSGPHDLAQEGLVSEERLIKKLLDHPRVADRSAELAQSGKGHLVFRRSSENS